MSTKRSYWLGTTCLALFMLLVVGVKLHMGWITVLDNSMAALVKNPNSNNTSIFAVIAFLGSPLVAVTLTVILAVVVWVRGRRSLSVFILGSQFGGAAVALLFKIVVARPRPAHELIPDTGYSFPSGHVYCTSMLIFGLFLALLPVIHDQEDQLVLVLLGLIWIGLVATARVYLGQHFASDVLASMLLAGGVELCLLPQRQLVTRIVDRLLPQTVHIEGE